MRHLQVLDVVRLTLWVATGGRRASLDAAWDLASARHWRAVRAL